MKITELPLDILGEIIEKYYESCREDYEYLMDHVGPLEAQEYWSDRVVPLESIL